MVLSETCLSRNTQKSLVTCISKIEDIKTWIFQRGFRIEVEIKADVDNFVTIGSGCKGREACPWREVTERHVATKVTGTDCPICLTELSRAMCRMELQCSHVFHNKCVMNWLKENPSCPICRAEAIGEIAFIY
ncbi:unnamed protein product [Microthlaspi erraticum]|uniref:RING-type E3 ubiquitin transferase n=1 Tax=Microthlaspi erraticum TaxID=1685480 RepID=A0A6D2IGU3_9BRAS|nr:unnamed protein product [Microthlaspi erraticum]